MVENKYEMYTKDCPTMSTGNLMYANPLKQPKPTVVNSRAKLEVTNPVLEAVIELDLYDDVVNSPLTPKELQESDYYETCDYSEQGLDDDTVSCVSMCVITLLPWGP